jgi:hypothetical protein
VSSDTSQAVTLMSSKPGLCSPSRLDTAIRHHTGPARHVLSSQGAVLRIPSTVNLDPCNRARIGILLVYNKYEKFSEVEVRGRESKKYAKFRARK